VYVHDGTSSPGVYLLTGRDADELPEVVRTVLARRLYWTAPAALTRYIYGYLTRDVKWWGGDDDDGTDLGISGFPVAARESVVEVDVGRGVVTIEALWADVRGWSTSFEDFVALAPARWTPPDFPPGEIRHPARGRRRGGAR